MIPFNLPCLTGDETLYMQKAIDTGQIAGNGKYTHLCQLLLKEKFSFNHTFLTPSGTAALEIAALLCEFRDGDEVILPSYTHVSTASAFIRAGAMIKFADCLPDHPNLDPQAVLNVIGPRSKALVVVHYGGVACDMDKFHQIAREHKLLLIEDAAHALGASYRNQWLGSHGDYAAFSFHETKNIHCAQGGMLVVNRSGREEVAREIWHHGTNRALFEKGEVSFYTWVRQGGAFLLSDLNAAFLYPQLRKIEEINATRMNLWLQYYSLLKPLERFGLFKVPSICDYVQHNAHIFFLMATTELLRDNLIAFLKVKEIQAVFHYIPLHSSPYAISHFHPTVLPYAQKIASCLLRLPLYDSLSLVTVNEIASAIAEWVNKDSAS